ncbi:MAG: hypothetical protein PHI76_04110 [Clostridia bacterium]|nr:hypothetical protein [Clostridia bacterium]
MKYNGFEKEEHFDRFSFYNGACIMKSETITNLKNFTKTAIRNKILCTFALD